MALSLSSFLGLKLMSLNSERPLYVSIRVREGSPTKAPILIAQRMKYVCPNLMSGLTVERDSVAPQISVGPSS